MTTADTMREKPKRPLLIMILCLVAWYGFFNIVFQVTSRSGAQRIEALLGADPSMPHFLAFRIFLTALSMVGYWFMRRWGVYLYSFMAVVSSLWTIFLTFRLAWYEYMMPIFIMWVGYYYWKRMT